MPHLHEVTNYDLLSATVDGEYSSEQIKEAAEELGISEDRLLGPAGDRVINHLFDKLEGS